MKLHELSPAPGSTHKARRVGRGVGSGLGKTSGRGHKGQKSRSGSRGGTRPGFEGGQMPYFQRLPKRGFVNVFATKYAVVNVGDLQERFEDGADVNADTLQEVGLVTKTLDGIKILGTGEISKKLNVTVSTISASAQEKIQKAGGKVEVI